MITCENHRPVITTDDLREAAEIIANRKARALYGKTGYARTCTLESWSEDGKIGEFNAFIGYRTGLNQTTGRNVRFTLTRRKEVA